MLEIQFEAQRAITLMAKFPDRTQRATVRALNRALTSGRATMASLISKDMGIKVKEAKDAIRVDEATAAHMLIRLRASKRRLPLAVFSARQTAQGVTYKIGTKGRGRIPNGFLATVRGPLPTGIVSPGHKGVFVRAGKARLPILERFGPSIGHVFEQHREAGVAKMAEVFKDRLGHELKFASTELG